MITVVKTYCPFVILISICCQIPAAMALEGMMRAAQFVPGGPELLTLGEVPVPQIRDHEVLLRVHATAINRADTLQRKGLYPPPAGESAILGLEAAGVVHKLGNAATKWKIGDRVMGLLPGGGNAEYVSVHEDHLMLIPETMSFTQAAAIPEVWLTAYQLLFFVGQLKAGETVLIHAGGSGVGTAATQLVNQAGARALVTAGSQEKIDKAMSLGAEAGFNYKLTDFSDLVMEHTKGVGVDVVLDCVGASYWEKNTKVLKVDSRWVLYGSMGGLHVDGNLLGMILRKRIQLLGSTLRTRSQQYKAELVSEFRDRILPGFTNGTFSPIIDTVLPLAQLSDAHNRMEANTGSGKIVIQVTDDKHKDEL